MATLTVEDLYALFQQACVNTGGHGYTAPTLSRNTAQVQAIWNEFHKLIGQYQSPPNALKASISAVVAKEDAILAAINQFEWDDQKTMYRVLYNLGHRVNS